MNKTFRYSHISSSVEGKQPTPSQLNLGEIAVNFAAGHEHLFIKNSSGDIISFDTPIEVSSVLTSGDTNAIAGGVVYDAFVENELVVANALNDLNEKKLDVSAYTPTSSATEIADALAEKLAIADFNVYSGAIDTILSDKQDTLTAGTGIDITNNVISVTGGSGGVTSGEVQTMIDESISGKVNTNDFDVYSAATENAINDKLDISDFNTYSGAVDTKFGDYYTTAQTSAATEIATALDGKVNTSNVTSAVTANSSDVLTSGGAYAQFGGLKLVKLTQSAYDNLPVKDSMTVYIIVDA